MEKTVIELDVREDIANKNDPFQKIMETISGFQTGDTLILHAPFEPVPLYSVLSKKSFVHETKEIDANHYQITFIKNEE